MVHARVTRFETFTQFQKDFCRKRKKKLNIVGKEKDDGFFVLHRRGLEHPPPHQQEFVSCQSVCQSLSGHPLWKSGDLRAISEVRSRRVQRLPDLLRLKLSLRCRGALIRCSSRGSSPPGSLLCSSVCLLRESFSSVCRCSAHVPPQPHVVPRGPVPDLEPLLPGVDIREAVESPSPSELWFS